MKMQETTKLRKKFLNELVDDKSRCVEMQNQQYSLTFQPHQFNDLRLHISDTLNTLVGKYLKKLNGILLGYQNVEVLPSIGMLYRDCATIKIDIKADFYVFKPTVGNILNGTVIKKSKNHITALVYDTFNVFLPKPKGLNEWPGSLIDIGQKVMFSISYMNLEGRLPYITANLIDCFKEESNILEYYTNEQNVINEEKGKSKKNNIKEEQQSDYSGNEENSINEEPIEEKIKNKKNKKYKENQDTMEYSEIKKITSDNYFNNENKVKIRKYSQYIENENTIKEGNSDTAECETKVKKKKSKKILDDFELTNIKSEPFEIDNLNISELLNGSNVSSSNFTMADNDDKQPRNS